MDTLRELARGRAVILASGVPATLVQTRPWPDTVCGKRVRAALAAAARTDRGIATTGTGTGDSGDADTAGPAGPAPAGDTGRAVSDTVRVPAWPVPADAGASHLDPARGPDRWQ